MQFLYPYFLWALTALAIPIIIHLFYFRRFKKVFFTNVKFLKEIKEETANRNKLKQLLILLSRLLALAALIFAFAQPFLPKGEEIKSGASLVSIFIDNSFSMTSKKDGIPLLDYSKERATSIVNAYSEDDQFQIITHDLLGKHQRLLSKEDALNYIDEIEPTGAVQLFSRVINRQNQLLRNENDNKIIYLISDFQKSISDFSTISDSLSELNLVPTQTTQQQNVSIDSVWFEANIPLLNQTNQLIVKVKNNANQEAEQVRLTIEKDGEEKPIGIINIPAKSAITDTFSLVLQKSGIHKATISITDYPVQFDDKYFVSFTVPDTIKALSINDGNQNRYLTSLFEGINYFNLKNQQLAQLQYQSFKNYDLIILNDLKNISSGLSVELTQYIKNGGKVLIFPSLQAETSSYNQFLTQNNAGNLGAISNIKKEVSKINTEEFIFNEVYQNLQTNLKLPVTSSSFQLNDNQRNAAQPLLTYRDGASYLSKYINTDGQLFLCSSPLNSESNDLVLNAEVFVPMLYKMAISTIKNQKIAHTISNKITLDTENKIKTGEYVYKVKGKEEFIPGQSPLGNRILLDMGDQIKEAGFYDLMIEDNVVETLAFNFDRKESDMDYYDEDELNNISSQSKLKINLIGATAQADIKTSISEKDRGVVLWKYFLFAALLFLLFETLLIRFWKT